MTDLTKPSLNPHETWWDALCTTSAKASSALLQTETSEGRHQRSVYELFAEMEEKDGHLYSVLQTRINGLLGLGRSILPGDESPSARRASEFAQSVLDALPRREDFLRSLLDALAKGFSVIELVWSYDRQGRLAVTDWVCHPQEYFLFDEFGRLLLLTPPFRPSGKNESPVLGMAVPGRAVLPAHSAVRPPRHKFLVMTFGRDARNPYGRGLCQRAYWYYWFKKNNLKFWAIYNEKFGVPTAVASYDAATSDEERDRLVEVLEDLQTEAGVVIPDSVTLQILDTARRGDGRTYRELADWCNDEISKIVLGATLTASEGRRSGSLALGTVHNAVRQDYVEADARSLSATINGTLLRSITELNFPPGTAVPTWTVDAAPPEDLELQITIDRELVRLGVPVPLSHFYERYGRPLPEEGKRTLSFDDSNLFQYHLQFGVLTINEVRRRLDLPPVPWGDGPPVARAVLPRSDRTGSPPQTPNTSEVRENPEQSRESDPREV